MTSAPSSAARAVAREIAEEARFTRVATRSAPHPNRRSDNPGGIHAAHHADGLPGVSECIQALRDLGARTEEIREAVGEKPAPGSRAESEYDLCQEPRALKTAYLQGVLLIFLGSADHLAGLERALSGRALSCTPFTCARAVLEACATGLWLLDSEIDLKERITRSLNYRLDSIRSDDRLRKKIKCQGDKVGQEWLSQNPAAANTQLIQHLRDTARRFGIPSRLTTSGKIKDFGPGMLSISERIGCAFGSEADYSILSLVAHSNQTGLTQLGARAAPTEDDTVLVRNLDPKYAVWLTDSVVLWHSKAAWAHFWLLGRGVQEAQEAFEDVYDVLGLSRELRFWRPTASKSR